MEQNDTAKRDLAAQAMNRSLNSVEKLWARGLAKLRDQMGGSP